MAVQVRGQRVPLRPRGAFVDVERQRGPMVLTPEGHSVKGVDLYDLASSNVLGQWTDPTRAKEQVREVGEAGGWDGLGLLFWDNEGQRTQFSLEGEQVRQWAMEPPL